MDGFRFKPSQKSATFILERPFGQAPIAIEGQLFLWWNDVLWPLFVMFGAFFAGRIEPQPNLHIFFSPTAKEIMEPTAGFAFAGQQSFISQAAPPKL